MPRRGARLGAMMGIKVDARDVLDTDGKTAAPFRGRIVGHFARTGPNSWDDFEYVARPEGEIAVHGGIRIQLEELGAEFRMRTEGRVVRVAWIPSDADRAAMERDGISGSRYFRARYVRAFDEAPGLGAAAVIVKKLRE